MKTIGWNHLDINDQRQFARNLVQRRKAYESWKKFNQAPSEKNILIVGDRPGPGAKDFTEEHHNTPFYSKTYCSGWMNAGLVLAGVPEEPLMWVNSASADGKPTDPTILFNTEWDAVFALGNNAAKWLTSMNIPFEQYHHPSSHRRFKSKEPYPLIDRLKAITNPTA